MGSRHSRDGDVRPDFAEALCGGMGTSEHESDQLDVGDHSRMPRALAGPANTTLHLAVTPPRTLFRPHNSRQQDFVGVLPHPVSVLGPYEWAPNPAWMMIRSK